MSISYTYNSRAIGAPLFSGGRAWARLPNRAAFPPLYLLVLYTSAPWTFHHNHSGRSYLSRYLHAASFGSLSRRPFHKFVSRSIFFFSVISPSLLLRPSFLSRFSFLLFFALVFYSSPVSLPISFIYMHVPFISTTLGKPRAFSGAIHSYTSMLSHLYILVHEYIHTRIFDL